MWSHLFLSTSLDILQSDDIHGEPAPDFSITINHGLEISTPQPQRRAWVLDTFDIKPTDSVLCAEFERLQIQFDFLGIQEKAKRVKRTKTDTAETDIEEEMLLGFASEVDTKGHTNELTHIVEEMKGLSGTIALLFEPLLGSCGEPDLLQHSLLTSLDQARVLPSPGPVQDIICPNENVLSGKGRSFPKAVTEILNAWFEEHKENPNPSKEGKLEIGRKTGLTSSQ